MSVPTGPTQVVKKAREGGGEVRPVRYAVTKSAQKQGGARTRTCEGRMAMEMRGREQVYRMSTRSGFLREGFVVQLLLRFANLLLLATTQPSFALLVCRHSSSSFSSSLLVLFPSNYTLVFPVCLIHHPTRERHYSIRSKPDTNAQPKRTMLAKRTTRTINTKQKSPKELR